MAGGTKLTRDNFQELLTPIHIKIINDEYKRVPEQYPQYMTVFNMRKKEETYPHIGAFGVWTENTEGNTINEDTMSEGDTATFTARRFDKGYTVTWELTKDDLYGVFDGRGKDGDARGLGRGLRATLETEAANVINNGFTNVGYDGKPLFASDHPLADSADVLDNLMTGPLTPANVKAGMTKMRQQVNEAGVLIQARAKQLLVGPDNEFTALELTKSTNQAFEQSNTKNVIEGLRPVVLDYINGSIWVLRDPDIENLKFGWRERPFFDSQKLQKTVDFFVFGYCRFDVGYCDIRGLVGSLGA